MVTLPKNCTCHSPPEQEGSAKVEEHFIVVLKSGGTGSTNMGWENLAPFFFQFHRILPQKVGMKPVGFNIEPHVLISISTRTLLHGSDFDFETCYMAQPNGEEEIKMIAG